MEKLSNPQTKIFDFIERYTRQNGMPPTNREIGAAVAIESTGHVDYHLSVLEKKGLIIRERKKARGIRLAHQEESGLRIEGTIAAGAPLDIFTGDQRETLDLSAHQREYVLLVSGQSMIEDHIADGDYVLVDRYARADDGDIVVAVHKIANGDAGAATLKRIYREDGRMRLQPANSQMEPIFITAEEWNGEWEVQGKVTAVYRRC
ncbi:MAG TPA: transcriptional repressor LexA [Ktedonobacterales bacterium]|nr:transcriptional repressor LexA [Ktedonobacterales bacterium]